MTDKTMPALRFRGFYDAWEQRKLGELVDIYDGTHQTPKYTAFGIKFVSVENISNLESKKFIDQEAYTKEYAKKPAEKGDVLMTRIGDIGTSHVVETDEPLAYYVTLALLKPKKIDLNFLSWLISSPKVQQNIWKRTLHIAFPKKINLGEINQVEASIPKESEQQQIGAFFKQLDNTIVQNERKIDILKQLKQAYLQKIFSQKLRFAGFSDDWKKRKLGDEVRIIMGQSPNSENYTDNANDHILVQGNADMKNGRVFPRVWTTQVTKQAEKNDLILSVRAPVGDIGKTAYDVVIGRGVAAIKGNEFVFQQLIKMKSDGYWTRYSTGSTFESINSNNLKEAVIHIPAIYEQQKIGLFFKLLDDTIALHQQKLNLLKKQKQAFLQKMFI